MANRVRDSQYCAERLGEFVAGCAPGKLTAAMAATPRSIIMRIVALHRLPSKRAEGTGNFRHFDSGTDVPEMSRPAPVTPNALLECHTYPTGDAKRSNRALRPALQMSGP
jgi:hypothetical protein